MPPILKCPHCNFSSKNKTSFIRHKVRMHKKSTNTTSINDNNRNGVDVLPHVEDDHLSDDVQYDHSVDDIQPGSDFDINSYQIDDLRLQAFQDKISSLITPSINDTNIKSGIEQLLRSNWVHGLNDPNNHGAPLFNDVMDIFDFISQNSLSAPQGDGVSLLIKKILLRHPTYEEVYLHRRFQSISSLLDNVLNGVYNMSVTHIPLPVQLRGGNNERKIQEINRILNADGHNPDLIIASGYSINLMEIIAETLVTVSLDSIEFVPVLDIDEVTGERKYSTFASADLFHNIFNRVQSLYGEDAYPFCIQWSQDATITSGGGGATKYEVPCYIRYEIINFGMILFSFC